MPNKKSLQAPADSAPTTVSLSLSYCSHAAPVAPELLLSVSTTHHTASLLWVLPEKAATNDTYSIVYWEHESPNSTLTRYNISSSSESRSGEFVLARLIGLGPGLLYEWAVETSNGIMTSQSAISSLTTQHVGEWLHCSLLYYIYTLTINECQS